MGRRLQLGLVAIALFSVGLWLGHTGSSVIRPSPSPVASAAAPTIPSTPAVNASRAAPIPGPSAILRTEDQGALFTALFDEEALLKIPKGELIAGLRDRFRRPWPRHATERDRELVRRVGILKALGRLGVEGQESRAKWLSFHTECLEAGPFLVRRQALRNLTPLLPALPEAERRVILKKAGIRALAAAAKSEREILEGLADAQR